MLVRRVLVAGDDFIDVSITQSEPEAPNALLAVYDEALPVVYGYFLRRLFDRGTAEDLTSETFLAAMDSARRRNTRPVSVQWLVGIARHKLADHFRRRHDQLTVLVPQVSESADAADIWDSELDRIVAEQTLARLSGPYRAVLTLRYLDDCSVDQCAQLMGRSVQATEALLVRARRAFRQEYLNRSAL